MCTWQPIAGDGCLRLCHWLLRQRRRGRAGAGACECAATAGETACTKPLPRLLPLAVSHRQLGVHALAAAQLALAGYCFASRAGGDRLESLVSGVEASFCAVNLLLMLIGDLAKPSDSGVNVEEGSVNATGVNGSAYDGNASSDEVGSGRRLSEALATALGNLTAGNASSLDVAGSNATGMGIAADTARGDTAAASSGWQDTALAFALLGVCFPLALNL